MSANGNDKQVIVCPHCNQRFSVRMPTVCLFNDPKVSVGAAAHDKPITCVCGKKSIPVFQALQISWAILAITDEQAAAMEGSPIIVPSGPIRVN